MGHNGGNRDWLGIAVSCLDILTRSSMRRLLPLGLIASQLIPGWQLRPASSPRRELPGQYFRLLDAGVTQVAQRLTADSTASLKALEAKGDGWRLFPHTVLAAAVLYAKPDAANSRYRNRATLALAMQIGDLLAGESEHGGFQARLNSDRDAYMWLEAYRVLEHQLGDERRARWRRELERNIAELAADSAERAHFPGYQSPFIGTSPNHLSLWASTVYLAGRIFDNKEWERIGASVMHRFTEEQSPDGFWGEHERLLPTPGYDYTTYAGMALYYEHSHDPAALEALRRGLEFHKYFTYPDGSPVEVLDDRNRYTAVAGWNVPGFATWSDENPPPAGNDESASKGQFGFSNFPEGRRYAELLTSFFRAGEVGYEDLGRIAQDALYYHAGPKAAIPQDLSNYTRRLGIPAGIRKTGPWVVCLSGLISTQAINNQFYHDRQGNLSIFHARTGLIITGANSKHQPELATFSERLPGQVVHMPISSRLVMGDDQDRLSLAYNTFFGDLYVPRPSETDLAFRFSITGKGRPAEDSRLTLQLCLKHGETLETGAGRKITLGRERVDLSPDELGGSICHHGWQLKFDPTARLVWPVYPHDPYTNAPEKSLDHAVGALSVPLRLKAQPGHYVRPDEQAISLLVEVK
jgi:hypothetical protein